MSNELNAYGADGNVKTLRSVRLGGVADAQIIGTLSEATEEPVAVAGGEINYTVDASPAVPLDPPTAAAMFARLRVYHSAQDTSFRLFYRQDGTPPTAAGVATGFLLHGEVLIVRLADFTDFQMIGETAMTGSFQVYVEWLNPASS